MPINTYNNDARVNRFRRVRCKTLLKSDTSVIFAYFNLSKMTSEDFVVVGTTNLAKLKAVRSVVEKLFRDVQVIGCKVSWLRLT